MSGKIYHILTQEAYKRFQNSEIYFPDNFDLDGFVHLSFESQVIDTLFRFYENQGNLILLEMKEQLKKDNRWKVEPSLGHGEFPHYYGGLTKEMVKLRLLLPPVNSRQDIELWFNSNCLSL